MPKPGQKTCPIHLAHPDYVPREPLTVEEQIDEANDAGYAEGLAEGKNSVADLD